jgi:hypothetical protein
VLRPPFDMSQPDLICKECPLAECDEDSLWCAFRWATNPNPAQMSVATFRVIPQRLTEAERSRRWRARNRERYNEVQREYRARKRVRDREALLTSLDPNRN